MAGELRGPPPPPPSHGAWPRDWLEYERYKEVHGTFMEALYREGVVEWDNLQFHPFRDRAGTLVQVRLEGELRCTVGVNMRVLKWMDARRVGRRSYEVLSSYYQYQAWLPKVKGRREPTLIRYDQAHGGTPHRHEY